MALLEVRDLHSYFKGNRGSVRAVRGVSYSLEEGKTIGIVGESGSGKSVSAMSILRLLPDGGYIERGEVYLGGKELLSLSEREMRRVRGNDISVIFQEPMTSLNPVLSIKKQLTEPFIIHRDMRAGDAYDAALGMLRSVRIPHPEAVIRQYPHELSGGMRQRVMIAMALACRPRVLIADEPTTALDVTVEAEILELMNTLRREVGSSIIFITHDLGVVSEVADEVAVMYCGQIVERAGRDAVFGDDGFSHPYTDGLLRSMPSRVKRGERLVPITGAVPDPYRLPDGCKFAPRCAYCTSRCMEAEPELSEVSKNHFVRCLYPERGERKLEG